MLAQAPADALFTRAQFGNIGLTNALDLSPALPSPAFASAVTVAGILAFALGLGVVGSLSFAVGFRSRLQRALGCVPQHHSAIHPCRHQSRTGMREGHEMNPPLMPG